MNNPGDQLVSMGKKVEEPVVICIGSTIGCLGEEGCGADVICNGYGVDWLEKEGGGADV